MRARLTTAGLFLCGLLTFALPAFAQTLQAPAQPDLKAQEANSLFEGLCLAYLGQGNKLLEQAYSIGAKPMPSFFAQQFLGQHKGVGLAIQGRGSLYMLGLTEQPSCLIAAPEANGVSALQIFGAGARRLLVTEGTVDGQYQQVYAVIKQDAVTGHQKSMIVIATISPQGAPGAVLNVLPAQTAEAMGIVPEKWPE